MSVEENKEIVGHWFTEFWGKDFKPAVIDDLAAPDIRFEYSLHAPCRGREQVPRDLLLAHRDLVRRPLNHSALGELFDRRGEVRPCGYR